MKFKRRKNRNELLKHPCIIQCKRCQKQYIGETKRTLLERFKEHVYYRQATNTQMPQQQFLPLFNQPGHSIADLELIPLELQPTLSMSRRKAREAYPIYRDKTLSPDGLNRRNEHWTVFYFIVFYCISYFYFYCLTIYLYIILSSIYNFS